MVLVGGEDPRRILQGTATFSVRHHHVAYSESVSQGQGYRHHRVPWKACHIQDINHFVLNVSLMTSTHAHDDSENLKTMGGISMTTYKNPSVIFPASLNFFILSCLFPSFSFALLQRLVPSQLKLPRLHARIKLSSHLLSLGRTQMFRQISALVPVRCVQCSCLPDLSKFVSSHSKCYQLLHPLSWWSKPLRSPSHLGRSLV